MGSEMCIRDRLMLPSQALLLLCHLDNDLVTIITYNVHGSMTVVTYLYLHLMGTFVLSRYPSMALARNIKNDICLLSFIMIFMIKILMLINIYSILIL